MKEVGTMGEREGEMKFSRDLGSANEACSVAIIAHCHRFCLVSERSRVRGGFVEFYFALRPYLVFEFLHSGISVEHFFD